MRRDRIIAGAVVAAFSIGGVAAAGAAPMRPAKTYRLSAKKSKLKFNVRTIRAKKGRVTLRMANPSRFPHAIAIKGKGKGRTVGKGGTSTLTRRLKKGKYTFYCPVPGHAAAGMRGRLIVR